MQLDDIMEVLESYWNQYQGLIIAISAIIIVWLIQLVLVRAARKSVRRAKLPLSAANGIVLTIRLVTLFLFFTILTSYAGLSSEVLALSGFIGAAIGFASSQTIGNVIAGIYVILTRPFRIGEYVAIGEVEGIVREINLNYTRIETPDSTRALVPNRKVLDERLRRFIHYLRPHEAEEKREGTVINKTLSFLRQTIVEDKEVYVYPFDVAIHTAFGFKNATKAFDKVCSEWTEKFGYTPTYYVTELPTYHIRFKFVITVENPRKILELQPEFLRAIIETLEQTQSEEPQ